MNVDAEYIKEIIEKSDEVNDMQEMIKRRLS